MYPASDPIERTTTSPVVPHAERSRTGLRRLLDARSELQRILTTDLPGPDLTDLQDGLAAGDEAAQKQYAVRVDVFQRDLNREIIGLTLGAITGAVESVTHGLLAIADAVAENTAAVDRNGRPVMTLKAPPTGAVTTPASERPVGFADAELDELATALRDMRPGETRHEAHVTIQRYDSLRHSEPQYLIDGADESVGLDVAMDTVLAARRVERAA